MTMRFAPLAHLRSTQPNSHLQGMPELASVRIEIRPHQNVMDLMKACWLRVETCLTVSNLGRDDSSVPAQHGPGAISIAVNSFRWPRKESDA